MKKSKPRSISRRPFYLTAKAYRAIGIPIPVHIPDDAVIDLQVEEPCR